ncbi:DUF421 domain-containing protein [Loktanella sp. M215]|uniref:DUF421 domain-containing protein n=1 Tax=Loktanella sp. M215 TaxID=2675431 RepID=UPI001F20CA09|nr:YetF domain-containing protein [Loktanella sp. M215]MCF7701715.1 DUF421 domain-containing protein [Loktanella sp. M215]
MPDLIEPIFRALIVVIAVVALCRLNGLRSFSKMSSFDFALTVATGSLVASTVQNVSQGIGIGLVSILAIFAVQFAIARLRQSFKWAQRLTDNEPLLLVKNGQILHDHLKAARVTEDDLVAKLREANAFSLNEVAAVVLETTGDISVMHSANSDRGLESYILKGVRTSV